MVMYMSLDYPLQKQEFFATLESGDYSKRYNFKPIERPKLSL